ncbi:MAG: tRNA (adenosine(37)-N6)-threonylcarbamoyltransferase complex dimerization subunit type 1 TsaB [Beggiatoa sp. IS2]|nr:MAG: tRNA (adenosine(37)-N6)-threonylcarbamoyltransferase complex dimerization subunit type 1 TsaB [Beggiatoa sp. IS2]
MKLLTLDTSTEACSCALLVEGEIKERTVMAVRQHAELILPMIDELLTEAGLKPTQLDALAVGRGPGSFTGVRIACGVAQGISFALDIPIIPLSSLATLAQAAYIELGTHRVLATIDARMNEIYYGYYILNPEGIMQIVGSEAVIAPEKIERPTGDPWYGVGSGWTSYHESLQTRLDTDLQGYQVDRYPQARAMIPLAQVTYSKREYVSAEQLIPVYLRNRVV